MRSRLTLFTVLLLLSVSTLVGAVTSPANRTGYFIATTVFHLFLFAAGYAVAQRWQHDRLARQVREQAAAQALRRLG